MNPVWKNFLLHTILVDNIYRFYERKDLLQYLEREVGHLKVLEAWVRSGDMNRIFPPVEGTYFWLGSEKKMTLYAVFVAYMERYLINPKCCEDNDSKIMCYIPEKSSRTGAEKLRHAHEILDEIVQMDEKCFPQDGDMSIYSRIDHLYKTWHNGCCSCGVPYGELECISCLKFKFILEELIHTLQWENTGYRRIFHSPDKVYMRAEAEHYRLIVVSKAQSPTALYGADHHSVEKGDVARFLLCKNIEKEWVGKLSLLCCNSILKRVGWEESKVQLLPLPTLIKGLVQTHLLTKRETIEKVANDPGSVCNILTNSTGFYVHS